MDKLRCCTTKAFEYYIEPHLSEARLEEDVGLVTRRVQIILDILVPSLNLYSKTILNDSTEVSVADEILAAQINTQEVRLCADEVEEYQKREEQCSKHFAGELTAENLEKMEKETRQKKIGGKFAKVSVLCTHISFSGLDRISTARIRGWRGESLPLLTARKKAAKALDPKDLDTPLDPKDLDTPLDSPKEVLRRFLWGSPKMRYLLYQIQRVILGKTRPKSYRKLFVLFQFPRSTGMFLKVC